MSDSTMQSNVILPRDWHSRPFCCCDCGSIDRNPNDNRLCMNCGHVDDGCDRERDNWGCCRCNDRENDINPLIEAHFCKTCGHGRCHRDRGCWTIPWRICTPSSLNRARRQHGAEAFVGRGTQPNTTRSTAYSIPDSRVVSGVTSSSGHETRIYTQRTPPNRSREPIYPWTCCRCEKENGRHFNHSPRAMKKMPPYHVLQN